MRNMDFSPVIEAITQIVDSEESFLASLPEDVITSRYHKLNEWNIKQTLGHLLDAASNCTYRIIHLQYQPGPPVFPDYDNFEHSDKWVAIQDYQTEDWHDLVQHWKYANLHLVHIIDRIDNRQPDNEDEITSLVEITVNYLRHLYHHTTEIHNLVIGNY